MRGSWLYCHIFLFLESLVLRYWMWLCAFVLADLSNLFVCILACASSCPLMHCIYCFACDMSVVPSVLLKDDAPSWDANSTPVAPRHPELCHSSKPRCHWRTANATGMSAGSQHCNPVGAYICGFTLEWRLSIIHTHLPLFTLHSNPQLVSQSETFSQKWPRSTWGSLKLKWKVCGTGKWTELFSWSARKLIRGNHLLVRQRHLLVLYSQSKLNLTECLLSLGNWLHQCSASFPPLMWLLWMKLKVFSFSFFLSPNFFKGSTNDVITLPSSGEADATSLPASAIPPASFLSAQFGQV